MTQLEFFSHIKHIEGQKSTVSSFFSEAFGASLDKLKISDEEKLSILQKAYRKMQYDRDVALAGCRSKDKELDKLRQKYLYFRQTY